MRSPPRSLLDAFLTSPLAGGLDYIDPADVRAVAERFLAACAELGRAPSELTGPELARLLTEHLPARYTRADRLGSRTIDVLRTYLVFIEPAVTPNRARELRVALEENADTFRALVRGE